MNIRSELTIVIPAKNEASLIPRLLTSLILQDYPCMPNSKVYLADASSTDGTSAIARSFADWLDIEVIPGGLPSMGRNAGARRATTRYVLFIDADIEIGDHTLIRRAMAWMKTRQLHCLTTNIVCPEGSALDRLLYAANNLVQQLSRLYRPFSTGMFMLFDKARFDELGGFDDRVAYAEDYLLSQKVSRSRFGILPGCVLTTNRRFRKMGHFKLVRMFLNTAINTWNESYYLRDHGYWQSGT